MHGVLSSACARQIQFNYHVVSHLKFPDLVFLVYVFRPALHLSKTGSVSLRPFLRFRVSRPGLFYDLSTGDSCPLRIPPTSRGLRFPPLISREKHGGLPTVTQKRPQSHTASNSITGENPYVSILFMNPIVFSALKRLKVTKDQCRILR